MVMRAVVVSAKKIAYISKISIKFYFHNWTGQFPYSPIWRNRYNDRDCKQTIFVECTAKFDDDNNIHFP